MTMRRGFLRRLAGGVAALLGLGGAAKVTLGPAFPRVDAGTLPLAGGPRILYRGMVVADDLATMREESILLHPDGHMTRTVTIRSLPLPPCPTGPRRDELRT